MPGKLNIYIWRHSKKLSSWSMFNEPHIFNDNYLTAEVAVLAESKDDALEILKKEDKWNIDEIRRIEPLIMPADSPAVIIKIITY
jgi:hypothetical protein